MLHLDLVDVNPASGAGQQLMSLPVLRLDASFVDFLTRLAFGPSDGPSCGLYRKNPLQPAQEPAGAPIDLEGDPEPAEILKGLETAVAARNEAAGVVRQALQQRARR